MGSQIREPLPVHTPLPTRLRPDDEIRYSFAHARWPQRPPRLTALVAAMSSRNSRAPYFVFDFRGNGLMAVDQAWESRRSNGQRARAGVSVTDLHQMGTSSGRERLLRLTVTTGIAVGVGLAVAEVLREPFGPFRLFIKAIAPIALALPVTAMLPMGTLRARVAALVAVTTMCILTALCLGVYGMPLRADVILPILALTRPEPVPFLAGLSLLLGVVILGRQYSWAPRPARAIPDVLVAAAEAVYFGGFLIGATQNLGPLAWATVAAALALSGRIRGVPTRRSVLGAAVFVGGMLWSESSYVAFLAHLSLLGHPRPAAERTSR